MTTPFLVCMDDVLKYLIIAIVAGGAVPIILSYLTKRPGGGSKNGPGGTKDDQG